MSLTRTENLAIVRRTESLRRFHTTVKTIAGGFAGAAVIMSPFALAFVFVGPQLGWEPLRLFVMSMAASCAAVAVVAGAAATFIVNRMRAMEERRLLNAA